jgi:hypothetical protein
MPDHPHTIDRWDDATGENLVEQIAAVGDYRIALETYRAAVKRWPKDKITLRNRARVIEQSWRGVAGQLPVPIKGGGIIRSASGGMIWETTNAMAAARRTANAKATASMP